MIDPAATRRRIANASIMGFIQGNVLPMLKEHAIRPFSGHVLCLGQADVYFTMDSLRRFARMARVELVPDVSITPSHLEHFAAKGYISGQTLFESIGFEQLSVLDCSDFEKADILLDLNVSELPSELRGKFDVIIDHGTIEHVFHIPNCLNNIFGMLKVGGRVIHSSPASNCVDHGFYMFSPTLYYDFYRQNDWSVDRIQLYQMSPNQEVDPPFFADYEPGVLDGISYGGLNDSIYAVYCIATKTGASTGDRIPQQSFYTKQSDW